ncbi:unnamed protein product [Musa hybrid cultivar]
MGGYMEALIDSGLKVKIAFNLFLSKMRPIFCGNFEYDAHQSELERLFGRYWKVDRVDMKSGFAFIYMDDERDAGDAIQALDRTEFGRHGRWLRIEWTKHVVVGRSGSSRRSLANMTHTKTLFAQEDATKALEATNMRCFLLPQFQYMLMDRVISLEYALRDDDDRRNGYSPKRRRRYRSLARRGRDSGRTPSPYGRGREKDSPDSG